MKKKVFTFFQTATSVSELTHGGQTSAVELTHGGQTSAVELAQPQRTVKLASNLSGDIACYVHECSIIDHFLILASSPLTCPYFQSYILKINSSYSRG